MVIHVYYLQQKKKKRHHDYKDYDKVEDDFGQSWPPKKDDRDRAGDRSPPSPYDSPDEDVGTSPRGDRDKRRQPSGDRRFNNTRGNRNRGRGGRNNRGRDRQRDKRDRDRNRDRRDHDKERDKRRNSGDGYRSPPGPYDSPSDEEYDDNK